VACGYEDQCWTLARVADQVWQRFGVEYNPVESVWSHLKRSLASLVK
jgi:hypothetical protein